MDLEGVIGSVVEAAGLELVEVSLRKEHGHRILDVTVDRAGGIDVEAIAEISGQIGRRLDQEGFDPGPYALEVGSPGVERALRSPADFVGRVGERVRVRTTEPVEGSRTHVGTILSAGQADVTIATETGVRNLPYGGMSSARTVFDWPSAGRAAERGTRGRKDRGNGKR